MILIFVSFENIKDAEKVAHVLVDEKLAACVSLIPVKSFYFWKGEKMTPHEVEAIIKTTEDKFDTIEKKIKELLSYEIPQIISVKVDKANTSYVKWLEEQIEI